MLPSWGAVAVVVSVLVVWSDASRLGAVAVVGVGAGGLVGCFPAGERWPLSVSVLVVWSDASPLGAVAVAVWWWRGLERKHNTLKTNTIQHNIL